MGAVYGGIPRSLAAFMQTEYDLSIFIETGTYMAATALWAADIFKEVYTIELSEAFYQRAIRKYSNIANIKFLHGSSSIVMKDIFDNEKCGPALFWLDAHCSGGDTAGEGLESPLVDEVKLILKSNLNHFILIDDAREILAAPPESLRSISGYPSLHEILGILDSCGPRYSIIWRDVMISVPNDAKESLYRFIGSQGDLLFWDSALDFGNAGLGFIIRCWIKALKGLRYLPGALYRSIAARMDND
jgi:hypothetical protein